MENELLNCPFCGGQVKLMAISGEPYPPTYEVNLSTVAEDSDDICYVHCPTCGANWHIEVRADAFPMDTIATWNRRPTPENKPIDGIELAKIAVALQQLKAENTALKAKFDEVNRYNISCTKEIDRLLAEKVAPENKPLTLEQLQQMDGEPVWIDGKDYGGWTIFKASANKQVARCLDNVNLSYYMRDYGKTWLAYARKPEREEK